jgi:hypothetical protein
VIAHSVIAHSVETGLGIFEGTAQIVNNTIVDGQYGIYIAANGSSVRNTIMTGHEKYGLLVADNVTLEQEYLAFWQNATHSYGGGAQTGNLVVDPCFTNAAADDYSLCAGSPLRDAGDPDAKYTDVDGSRNDIGATGSPQFVQELLVPAPVVTPDPTPTPKPSLLLVPPVVEPNPEQTEDKLFMPFLDR